MKPLSVHGLWLAVMTIAGRGAALDDLVRAHLGGHGARAERHRDVVGEDHLGRGHREVLRSEPPVVGEDDALGLLASPDDVACDAIRAAPDVLEREVLGDARPPAVGAERRSEDFGAASVTDVPPIRPPGPRAHRPVRGCAAAPASSATGFAARISRGPSLTASRPPMRSTIRSASSARTASFGETTRPAPVPPSAARSCVHEPRSLQPTAIEAITTRRSLAAPSITAWSMEIGFSRSYAAVRPGFAARRPRRSSSRGPCTARSRRGSRGAARGRCPRSRRRRAA